VIWVTRTGFDSRSEGVYRVGVERDGEMAMVEQGTLVRSQRNFRRLIYGLEIDATREHKVAAL
jgi:hypothetical protein